MNLKKLIEKKWAQYVLAILAFFVLFLMFDPIILPVSILFIRTFGFFIIFICLALGLVFSWLKVMAIAVLILPALISAALRMFFFFAPIMFFAYNDFAFLKQGFVELGITNAIITSDTGMIVISVMAGVVASKWTLISLGDHNISLGNNNEKSNQQVD